MIGLVLALQTMQMPPGVQRPIIASPQGAPKQAYIITWSCTVTDETQKKHALSVIVDDSWDGYRYPNGEKLETAWGEHWAISGPGRFAGWHYLSDSAFLLKGRSFIDNAGNGLTLDFGVTTPPSKPYGPYSGPLRSAVTLAAISSDRKSASFYTGVCTRVKTEQVQKKRGVRDLVR